MPTPPQSWNVKCNYSVIIGVTSSKKIFQIADKISANSYFSSMKKENIFSKQVLLTLAHKWPS